MAIRHQRLYVSLSCAHSKNVMPLFNGVTKSIFPALCSCADLILSTIFQSQNNAHEILRGGGVTMATNIKGKRRCPVFFALCRRLSLLLKATEGVLNTVC